MKKFNATTKKWLDIIITLFVILFISFIIIKVIPKEITGGNYVEAKIESISKNKISVFIEDTHGNVFNVKKGDSISIPYLKADGEVNSFYKPRRSRYCFVLYLQMTG